LPDNNLIRRILPSFAIAFSFALILCSAWVESYNSGREIGIRYQEDEKPRQLIVADVRGPAARAGLAKGDIIVSVAGRRVLTNKDYEDAAKLFRPGYPVKFEVKRADKELDFNVRLEAPFSWGIFLLHVIGVTIFLVIGVVAQKRRPGYLRANLLSLYCAAVILELGMPAAPRGHPYIGAAFDCLFYLLSGLQFGLGLHLISVFPERRTWLIKHPKLIPGYYFVGIGFGAVVAVTAVTETIKYQLFPWTFDFIYNIFSNFFLPAWACATVALLISTARRYPHLDGRREAILLLVGILPWAILVVVFAVLDSAFHVQPPVWAEILVLLVYPALIAVVLWREFKLAEQLLLELAPELHAAESADQIMSIVLAKTSSALHPAHAFAWLRKPSGIQGGQLLELKSAQGEALQSISNTDLFAWIERSGEILDVELLDRFFPREVEEFLNPFRVALVVPIVPSRRKLEGLLMLGYKKTEDPYTLHDRKLLRAISVQAAVHLELLSRQMPESRSISQPKKRPKGGSTTAQLKPLSRISAERKLKRKRKEGAFDVFLCHNSADKPEVKKIAEQLKDAGILPWLDEWELQPGLPWQRLLESQIASIKSAAVFVGAAGVGPWQQNELDAFLREFVDRQSPVIPVLLADSPEKPELPRFLRAFTWVDFRALETDPLTSLIWGITGNRPE
jgi:hypothetical protein